MNGDEDEEVDCKNPFTLEMEVDEEISFKPLASLRERYQIACQSSSGRNHKDVSPPGRMSAVTSTVKDHAASSSAEDTTKSTSSSSSPTGLDAVKSDVIVNAVDVLSEIDSVMKSTVASTQEKPPTPSAACYTCEFCLAEFATKNGAIQCCYLPRGMTPSRPSILPSTMAAEPEADINANMITIAEHSSSSPTDSPIKELISEESNEIVETKSSTVEAENVESVTTVISDVESGIKSDSFESNTVESGTTVVDNADINENVAAASLEPQMLPEASQVGTTSTDDKKDLAMFTQVDMDRAVEHYKDEIKKLLTASNAKVDVDSSHVDTSSFADQIRSLESTIATKDKDLLVLANLIEELQQSQTLSDVTNKAITQRLQSVENELVQAREEHEMQILEMQEEFQVKLRSVQTRLIDKHSGEKKSLESLLIQEKNDREADMATYRAREEEMLEQMKEAVKDAKKRVYEKAQSQFANGNKEYNKLKGQYKEMTSSKEKLSAELKISSSEVEKLNKEILVHKETISKNEKQLHDYIEMCDLAVKHFGNSNIATTEQSSTEKLELAKASIGIQFKQFNELKTSNEEIIKKLRDSELSCEMKDGQIEKLRIQISDQEKLVEKGEKNIVDMENQMNEMQAQADAQNNVIAKLMVNSNNAQTIPANVSCVKCDELKRVNMELEERCVSLRAMNEEVMGMLESMNGVTA